MNYTITPGGIVYSFDGDGSGQDYQHEEAMTDSIADTQSEPKPIPDDEAVQTMHEISAWIEAMG